MDLKTRGGTTLFEGISENFALYSLIAGISKATSLYDKIFSSSSDTNGNRIIFLTDMIPNSADKDGNLLFETVKANATKKLYTTFIGIGVGKFLTSVFIHIE